MNVSIDVLFGALRHAARAAFPSPDRHDRAPLARRVQAERLYQVPGEVWFLGHAEWRAMAGLTAHTARGLLARLHPEAADRLRRGLLDPASVEGALYHAGREAAFPAAFALGYAFGLRGAQESRRASRRAIAEPMDPKAPRAEADT